MKHIYRYLLAVALVPAFLFTAPGLSQADNNFQQPVKKSMQLPPHKKIEIMRNGGPKPAHHSVSYTKKKNDSFSHLNN
jgi:hypothetical protein